MTELIELPMLDNGLVERADLDYRSGAIERVRSDQDLAAVLRRRPDHVLAHLVRALNADLDQTVLEQNASAFPHAFALRALAARQTSDEATWSALRRDFPRHLALVHLIEAIEHHDGERWHKVQQWMQQGEAGREPAYSPYLRRRLEGIIFARATERRDLDSVLRAADTHRPWLEHAVRAALKIAADEEPPLKHALA
jgi:hypothetical protein